MNNCCNQQKNALRSCEEMKMETVVCPKPRRFGMLNHSSINNHHIRPFKPQIINYHSEIEDSGVREDLLDIILPKGNCYNERFGDLLASSPPFFYGSPPSRASNPLIQDEQFGNSNDNCHGNFSPLSMAPSSPSSSARNCVPKKFGHTQAAVRIEGFDCLNRDRRNRSISAVA